MYSLKKKTKGYGKKLKKWKHNRKLQNTKKRLFWNLFVDMIYFIVAVSMRLFADISKETLPKRRIWVNIESLVYLTLEYLSLESLVYLSLELLISFINCSQEGASYISKQRAVKKKMRICVNIKATRTKWIQSILNFWIQDTLYVVWMFEFMFEFMLT